MKHYRCYLLVEEPLVLGELELGDLVLDELLGELLEPELLLGELLEPELLPLIPDELPPDAPVELEPDLDLLKCASHSACEIWPSLLVSTDEKLGAEALPLEVLLPEAEGDDEDDDGVLDEPLELLPDAAGEDEDEDGLLDLSLELLPVAEGEDDEDEDGLLDLSLELLPVAEGDEDGLDGEEDDCATARDDSANITAAAVMLRVLGMD